MEGKEITITIYNLEEILFDNFVFGDSRGLVEQSMSEGHFNLEEICQKFLGRDWRTAYQNGIVKIAIVWKKTRFLPIPYKIISSFLTFWHKER